MDLSSILANDPPEQPSMDDDEVDSDVDVIDMNINKDGVVCSGKEQEGRLIAPFTSQPKVDDEEEEEELDGTSRTNSKVVTESDSEDELNFSNTHPVSTTNNNRPLIPCSLPPLSFSQESDLALIHNPSPVRKTCTPRHVLDRPDPQLLDECSDEMLNDSDRKALKSWSYLIVENSRDSSTWHLPYRDGQGRLNRPLMSEAREILKSSALVKAKNLLISRDVLRNFTSFCRIAWPNNPIPRFVRAVDEDEDSDSSGSPIKPMVEVLKSTACVLQETREIEQRHPSDDEPDSPQPIIRSSTRQQEAKQLLEPVVDRPEKRSDVSVDLLMKFRKIKSERPPLASAMVRQRVFVQPRDKHRAELAQLAQSRFLDVRNRKAAAARKVDERYVASSAAQPAPAAPAAPPTSTVCAVDGVTITDDPLPVTNNPTKSKTDDDMVIVPNKTDPEDDDDSSWNEDNADGDNSTNSDGDDDADDNDGSSSDDENDAEQEQEEEELPEPPQPSAAADAATAAATVTTEDETPPSNNNPRNLAYRRMLEADARRGTKQHQMDLLAEEASEEDEDDAVGNYGGGVKADREDDDDEELLPQDLKPTEDDLKHIVDTVSDDEGEGDAADLFRQQVEAKDDAELKRIQKDVENHTLALRRRNLDGTRLGRALDDHDSESETDEEMEMARQERYETETKERLAELQANNNGGNNGNHDMNESMEEVLAEEEQARRFLTMSRLQRQRTLLMSQSSDMSSTTTHMPHTTTSSSSTLQELNRDDEPTRWPTLPGDRSRHDFMHETENTNFSFVSCTELSNLPSVSTNDGHFVKSVVKDLKSHVVTTTSRAAAATARTGTFMGSGSNQSMNEPPPSTIVTSSSSMAFISNKKFVYTIAPSSTTATTMTTAPTTSNNNHGGGGSKKRMALSSQTPSSAAKRRRAMATKPLLLSRTASLLLEEASMPSSTSQR